MSETTNQNETEVTPTEPVHNCETDGHSYEDEVCKYCGEKEPNIIGTIPSTKSKISTKINLR